MDDETDYLARLTLHHVIEPADPVFSRLQEFAGADQLLAGIRGASLPDLEPDPVRRDRVAERSVGYRLRLEHVDLDATMAAAEAVGAAYLTPGHEHWPAGFDDLGPERPLGVWWLGSWLASAAGPVVSMVGARACTGYGSYVAGALAAALGQAGVPVASGGALGIDAASHRGALAVGGDSIAFLACGIDLAYPRTNERLFRAIQGQGAVVSELPPGCHPNRFRFLTRNRLIAALGTATVVVEAAKRSGSLVTARRAADLGRQVFAVPGPITSGLSVGTHELIRDGAQIVESPQQLAADLGDWASYAPPDAPPPRPASSDRMVATQPPSSRSSSRSSSNAITRNGTCTGIGSSAADTIDNSSHFGPTGGGDSGNSGDPGGPSRSAGRAPGPGSLLTAVMTAKTPDPDVLTGLGPEDQLVLEALPTAKTSGIQIPQLSGATGIEPGNVFAGLGRLAALGLAVKNTSGWVLAPGRERRARRYE
ncbi:MAG TPA: DNA-processing protein DprA [Actinocrinis sp.]|nr:DNA-processing protein DprA [Actinocrinis sp.]